MQIPTDPIDPNDDVPRLIRAAMLRRQLNQAGVARALGVSEVAVSRYLSSQQHPTMGHKAALLFLVTDPREAPGAAGGGMSANRRPRSIYRIVHDLGHDPRLPLVWDDLEGLGVWFHLRLTQPRRADLPRALPPGVPMPLMQALAAAGVVELLANDQFRLLPPPSREGRSA